MSNQKLTLEELLKLNKPDLQAKYEETFGEKPAASESKESLANAIDKNEKIEKPIKPAASESKEMFGNKDKDKKYPFDPKHAKSCVVRHFRNEKLGSGAVVEDPGSSRIQFYEPDIYDKLSKQPVVNGKQKLSEFQLQGLEVELLHDPRA